MKSIFSTLVIAAGVSLLSASLHAATLTSLSGSGSVTDAEGKVKSLIEKQALMKGDVVLVKKGTAVISGCGKDLTLKENQSVKILEDDKCAMPINLATGAGVAVASGAATTTTAFAALAPLAKLALVAGGIGVVAAARDDDPVSP